MKKRAPILLSLVLPAYLFGVSDFELINHNSKDITGSGIFIGIIDSAVRSDHPNLIDKVEEQIYSKYNGVEYQPNFLTDTHGSHVAGIMVANGNDGVEGVAKDATLYAVQRTGYNTTGSGGTWTYPNVYDFYSTKNVKVINNSWNATTYPLSGLNSLTSSSLALLEDPNTPSKYLPTITKDPIANDLIRLSKEKQVLSVFASGNEGIISPGIMALAPYYDEEIRSMIAVTALDSSQITKNQDGKFVINVNGDNNYVNGATIYANGLKGAYNFGLAAPGTNIKNVNASYNLVDPITGLDKNKFRVSNGTSMAAPMVTAAGALVAQKFPFMNGKQIADVLLSTANRDYIMPKVIVKETETGATFCDGGNPCARKKKYTVFYIDNEIPRKQDGSIDENAVEIDLITSGYYESGWKFDRMSHMANVDDKDYPWVQEITKEDLFGQGILDIDKALNGIGILDANRLSDSDVKSDITGSNEAYYSLNLGTHNAEFSNDISQRKWEANTHNSKADNLPKNLNDLNVGLIKTGSGILTLSGTNTYEGATVIDGGEIKLRSVDTKTAQIAGNVYVNNGSTLSGNGIIKKDLTNSNSTVRPGNADLTDLTVDGTYTQKGNNSKLVLDFGNDKNSKLVAENYNIENGKLEYNPLEQYFTVDKEVKIELGKLTDHISKFDEVLVASNNSIKFDVKLDTDKTTINKDPNKIPIQPNTGEQGSGNLSGQDSGPTIGEASIGSGATSGGSDSSGGDGSLNGGLDIGNGGVSGGDDSNPNGGDNRNPAGSSSGDASQGGNSSANLNGGNGAGADLSSNQGSQGGSNLTPNNTGTNSAQSGQNDDKSSSSPASGSTNPNPSSGGSSGLSSSTNSQTNPSTSSTQNTPSSSTQNSQTSGNVQGDTGGNQPTQPNQDSNQGSQGGSNLTPNNTGTNSAQSGQNDDKSSSGSASGITNPNPSSGGSSGLSSSTNSQTNPSTSSAQNTPSPSTQNSSTQNSQTSGNVQGNTGANQPTQPNQDNTQGSNPSNTPANTNQNNSGSNVDTNSQTPSQNNNTQGNKTPNNNGAIIVTPVVRSDAYASNSAQLSQTMRDIRGRNDLNPQYQQFFATLDSSTKENYKSIMSRIEGRSIGDMTSIQSSTHNNFMQNNMLFSLNPATSTLFAYNQNPYDSGVLVASVASDYIIDLGLNSATPKDYWYINPTFKRYNGDGFDGYQSGASVNLAQHIGSNGLIAYGIGASLSKLDFDIGATAKSSNFDIALNYTHDFESFKLLSGGSFMVSFNENERTVANTLSSDYKSYSSSLQLGVAKDFRHYSIVVTPLGYLGYGKIYQESFKESGDLFAKNYDSINHDIYTVGMGLNLAYEGSDEKSRYTGYIIYERMLDGYNMDASAEFNDFKGQKFSQRYHLDKNRLNLGVGAEYAFNSGYFAKFGIGSEFATTSDNYNLSVTFGKRF